MTRHSFTPAEAAALTSLTACDIDVRLTALADDSHPSVLAFTALNNAAQLLAGDHREFAEPDLIRARELLAEGTAHVAALHLLLIQAERALANEQRAIETVIRGNSRLHEKLIQVQHAAKQLVHLVGKPKEFQRPMSVTESPTAPHLEVTK